jgi:hypothetical protein
MTRLTVKTDLVATKQPVCLTVEGRAEINGQPVAHDAVPAEDRMQAFLWRHLVPAQNLVGLVFDPNYRLPPKRVAPVRPPPPATPVTTNTVVAAKGKFTKQQIEGRLRELKRLYEEGLLTDEFYDVKITECEAAR